MVRSTILSLILIMSPTGTWIDSTGKSYTVQCPEAFIEDEITRLPAGCKLDAPAVAFTRSEYIRLEENLAALEVERGQWKAAYEKEKELREQVEADLDSALTEFDLQLSVLRSTCKSELDCPQIKPAFVGAVTSLTLCASVWATSKMLR